MNSETFDLGDRMFWFKLGTHTCNMKRMSFFCGSILSHHFAKSSRFCTKFSPIGNSFIHVQGILDSIVCLCFPKNEDNDFNETLGAYVNHVRPNVILNRQSSYTICDVFYNLQSIEEPDIVGPFREGRYSKRITYEQHDYIVSFVQQFGEYLDYLERMINHMVNNIPKKCSWSEKEWDSKRGLLKKSVRQLRKKWEHLHIISEIETE